MYGFHGFLNWASGLCCLKVTVRKKGLSRLPNLNIIHEIKSLRFTRTVGFMGEYIIRSRFVLYAMMQLKFSKYDDTKIVDA